jgi:substrate-binding family protein
MRRRKFITLLGGAAVAWPLAARAQQPTRLPLVAVLRSEVAGDSEGLRNTAALIQGLQALGWTTVLHYLKALQAAGTTDGKAVADKIRKLPVDDFFAKGWVREDGRMMHDMYLVEVKAPSESKATWDYYKVLRRIPGEEAAQPLSESKCSLVKK